MPRDRTLPLTDSDRTRPSTKGGDETRTSLQRKRAQGPNVKPPSGRITQVAVGAAPRPAYTVRDEAFSSESPTRPLSSLQRSQTAPNGIKRPRDQNAFSVDASPALTRPVTPTNASRGEFNRSRLVKDGRERVGEDSSTTSVAAVPKELKRTFGEMLESQEVEALCLRLGLTTKDVWRLRKEFNDEDTENTGTITVSSFFYLIHEEKRALTKSLLRLAGLSSPTSVRLSFDEYVRCVVTFATFTEPEVFQFFFQVYSDNTGSNVPRTTHTSSAHMVESDLMKFGQDLQLLKTAFAGNVKIATGNATVAMNGQEIEGSLTFGDFERFSKQHMVAFFPLLQIQRNVRRAGDFGEAFWVQKTSEKRHVEQMLAYMKKNHGFQPPLPLKDRIASFVLQRPTTQARVRELAKRLYSG